MHTLRPEDKVPWKSKLAYGFGFGPIAIADKGLVGIGMPVFNIIFGISPGLVSLVLGLSRVWDAFTDPVVGNISDNIRTRWGRRRPLIALGSPFAGLFIFILYMMPTDLSEPVAFTYYLVFTLLFYTALSFHMVPYEALGYVISADHIERSKVFAWRALAAKFFLMTVAWGYAFIQSDLFESEIQGVRVTGILLGLMVFGFGVLPALFVRERGYKTIKEQKRVRFLEAAKGLLNSRPAMMLLGTFVFLKAPSVLVGGIDFYAVAYYVCGADLLQAGTIFGLSVTAQMISSIIGIAFLPFLVERFEKKHIVHFGICAGVAAAILKYPLFNPHYPYLVIIPNIIIGPTLSVVWALLPSMMADVVDQDEYECGLRREGTFSACWQWSLKAAAALGMAVSGFLLEMTGFDESLGAEQGEATLNWLRLLVVLVPMIFYATALFFIGRYPLTSAQVDETRVLLEERRGRL